MPEWLEKRKEEKGKMNIPLGQVSCDVCGKPLSKGEGQSTDGDDMFCADCWDEMEIENEVMNNQKMEGQQ